MAVVFIAKASVPLPASLKQKLLAVSVASLGSHLSCKQESANSFFGNAFAPFPPVFPLLARSASCTPLSPAAPSTPKT